LNAITAGIRAVGGVVAIVVHGVHAVGARVFAASARADAASTGAEPVRADSADKPVTAGVRAVGEPIAVVVGSIAAKDGGILDRSRAAARPACGAHVAAGAAAHSRAIAVGAVRRSIAIVVHAIGALA